MLFLKDHTVMVLLLELRTLLTCLIKPAGTYLLKCKAVNIVYITSYLPTPSITTSYVNEGTHSHTVYIICLDFLLLTDVCSNIFKSCLWYMNYRFLDFFRFCNVFCSCHTVLCWVYVCCIFMKPFLIVLKCKTSTELTSTDKKHARSCCHRRLSILTFFILVQEMAITK